MSVTLRSKWKHRRLSLPPSSFPRLACVELHPALVSSPTPLEPCPVDQYKYPTQVASMGRRKIEIQPIRVSRDILSTTPIAAFTVFATDVIVSEQARCTNASWPIFYSTSATGRSHSSRSAPLMVSHSASPSPAEYFLLTGAMS
jgi:hypothetical protein